MNISETIFKEATEASDALKDSLFRLLEIHDAEKESQDEEGNQAMLNTIGKVTITIEALEIITENSITDTALTETVRIIKNAKSIQETLSVFLSEHDNAK